MWLVSGKGLVHASSTRKSAVFNSYSCFPHNITKFLAARCSKGLKVGFSSTQYFENVWLNPMASISSMPSKGNERNAISGIMPRVWVFALKPYSPSFGTVGLFLLLFPVVWLGGFLPVRIIYSSVAISLFLHWTKCLYSLYFLQEHCLMYKLLRWAVSLLLLPWPGLIFWDQWCLIGQNSLKHSIIPHKVRTKFHRKPSTIFRHGNLEIYVKEALLLWVEQRTQERQKHNPLN